MKLKPSRTKRKPGLKKTKKTSKGKKVKLFGKTHIQEQIELYRNIVSSTVIFFRTFDKWPLDDLIKQCEKSIQEDPVNNPEMWERNGDALLANHKLFTIAREAKDEWKKIESLYNVPAKTRSHGPN